jgi:Rrf2 family protein
VKLTPTRRTDYGLASLIELAEQPERTLTASDLARSLRTSPAFVHAILRDLARAELVRARTGPRGGYALARPASEISVLQVVDALEGALTPNRCSIAGMPCRWDPVCPRLHPELGREEVCILHQLWTATRSVLAEHLTRITLAEIAAGDVATLGEQSRKSA